MRLLRLYWERKVKGCPASGVCGGPDATIVRLDNGAVEPPDHNCHNVGVDQAPNPGLALSKIGV